MQTKFVVLTFLLAQFSLRSIVTPSKTVQRSALMRYRTLLPYNNVNLNLSSISIHFPPCLNDTVIPLTDELTELLRKSMAWSIQVHYHALDYWTVGR